MAYDWVLRMVLWYVLKKKRVLMVYVKIMQDMYNEARTRGNTNLCVFVCVWRKKGFHGKNEYS